jgi:ABC-type uncharacterized transport system substrate-binding protein
LQQSYKFLRKDTQNLGTAIAKSPIARKCIVNAFLMEASVKTVGVLAAKTLVSKKKRQEIKKEAAAAKGLDVTKSIVNASMLIESVVKTVNVKTAKIM